MFETILFSVETDKIQLFEICFFGSFYIFCMAQQSRIEKNPRVKQHVSV